MNRAIVEDVPINGPQELRLWIIGASEKFKAFSNRLFQNALNDGFDSGGGGFVFSSSSI